MYAPKGIASKTYAAFCDALQTSPYLSRIESWFDGTERTENDSASQNQVTAVIGLESGSSGWVAEDQHGFEMTISVTVSIPGRRGLECMDLAESVVTAIFPGNDQEAREISKRVQGDTAPVAIEIGRFPASFEYDDDARVTTSTIVFKLTIHHQTIGEYS